MPRSNDPMQTSSDVLRAAMIKPPRPGTKIVTSKLFHHNNLILQLVQDSTLDVYFISVHRVNDQSDTELWGIYNAHGTSQEIADGFKAAKSKFNTIRL